MRHIRFAALISVLIAPGSAALAQQSSITGHLSGLIDRLPNADATEVRVRAVADTSLEAKPWLRFRFAGLLDLLGADRRGGVTAASADALEAWVEAGGRRGDIRAGMSRISWGRLDEIQPTDVINPIDVSRFLLDGRAEARIAVPLLRGRVFAGENFTVEGVLVPWFRPGRFDRLDEETSPFNLLNDIPPPACPALPDFPCPDRWTFRRESPDAGEVQGGARVSVTTGRVDWGLSAWNGFVPFALLDGPLPDEPATLQLSHPRYSMLGAEFETVVGTWAVRGEAALFLDRPVQVEDQARWFEADTAEAGVGVDRRAGDFTLFGTLLFRHANGFRLRRLDGFVPRPTFDLIYERTSDSSVSLVAGFSRTFNRDRIETRLFSLVNPEDRSSFVRGLLTWRPMDDVAIETSIGWFAGDGRDVITQFSDRDFAYVRLKYFFGS